MKNLILIISVIFAASVSSCSSSDDYYEINNTEWISNKFTKSDSIIYYKMIFTEYNNFVFRRFASSSKTGLERMNTEFCVYEYDNNTLKFNSRDTDVLFNRNGDQFILKYGFSECPSVFYRQ